MKKHFYLWMPVLFLCVVMLLSSCSKLINVIKPDETLPDDVPYDLVYWSNGNDTCAIRAIVPKGEISEPFTLIIPKKSPAGDTVVSINLEPVKPFPTQHEGGVPAILRAEDFDELCEQMKDNKINDFDFNKFTAYYVPMLISEESQSKVWKLVEEYPFLSIVGDAYVFDTNASADEAARVNKILQKYSDWTDDRISSYYAEIDRECRAAMGELYSAAESGVGIKDPALVTEIVLPDSLQSIGSDTFAGFTSVTTVSLPESLLTIGNGAFTDCIALTSIEIPANVEKIGKLVFAGCNSLTSISVSADNQTYLSEGNCLIEKETMTLVIGCDTSVIPESVTSIEDKAFENCTGLKKVTIPANVTHIGDNAFAGCTSLESIDFSNSKKLSVGEYAFAVCTGLTQVTIPENSKGWTYAFAGCTGITSATILSTVEAAPFQNCSALTHLTFGPNCYVYLSRSAIGEIKYTTEENVLHLIDQGLAVYRVYETDDEGNIVYLENGEASVLRYDVSGNLPIQSVSGGVLCAQSEIGQYGSLTELKYDRFDGDCVFQGGVLLYNMGYVYDQEQESWGVMWIDPSIEILDLEEFFEHESALNSLRDMLRKGQNAVQALRIPTGFESFAEQSIAASLTDIYYEGSIVDWLDRVGQYFGDACTIHCSDGDVTKEHGEAMVGFRKEMSAYLQLCDMREPFFRDILSLEQYKAELDQLLLIKGDAEYESYAQYEQAEEGSEEYELYQEYLEYRTVKSRYTTNRNRRLNDLCNMYNYWAKIDAAGLAVEDAIDTFANEYLPVLAKLYGCEVKYEAGKQGDLRAITNLDQLPERIRSDVDFYVRLYSAPQTPAEAKAIVDEVKAAMIEPGYITEEMYEDKVLGIQPEE